MKVEARNLGKAVRENTVAQAAALKRAAVRTLTRAAGMAQDTFIDETKQIFKAPVAFTTDPRGYKFTKARSTAGKDPESKFTIKAKQSAYLQFPISGGQRDPGDAGTSEKYVWKPTKFGRQNGSSTASGALLRRYTKQLVSESKRKRPVRGGGIYFGSVPGHGDTGFILRPARTLAVYVKGLDGKMHLARPSGADRVRNVNTPHMLAKADKDSKHRQIVPYEDIMRAAMDEATSELGRRLQQELAK